MWSLPKLHHSSIPLPFLQVKGRNEWLVYLVTHVEIEQSGDVILPSPSYSFEHQSLCCLKHRQLFKFIRRVKRLMIHVLIRRAKRLMIHVLHQFLCPLSSDPPLENLDLPVVLCKVALTCNSIHSIANFVSCGPLSSMSRSLIASLYSISIPKTVKESLNYPRWSNAMLEEIHASEENHMWNLVDLPHRKNQLDVSGSSQSKLI